MSLVTRAASALGLLRKAAVPRAFEQPGGGGWMRLNFGRPETDFQRDIRWTRDGVLANATLFACITLIASDIGKMRFMLVEKTGRIWQETDSATFSPVIRKPNGYQTHQQFFEMWAVSKIVHGNAYVLKERNGAAVVSAMHVLDPNRVSVKVTSRGEVFYALQADDLAKVVDYGDDGLAGQVLVPASEMMHDRMVCLFHPLVGTSPLYANGLAATQALEIQRNATRFFRNGSRPGVILSAPGQISDDTALRVKQHWESEYSGENIGRVAVLGDDLKPVALAANADVSQLVEQLKLSSEMICSTLHVPGFKVGVGAAPTYQNAGVLNQVYYSDCLQKYTEAIEALFDEGLGLTEKKDGRQFGTMFDLDDLMKTDLGAYATTLGLLIDKSVMAPNEARAKLNLPPVPGGESPMIQQQNYSLAAIGKRDAQDDPFATEPAAAPVGTDEPAANDDNVTPAAAAKVAAALMHKALSL